MPVLWYRGRENGSQAGDRITERVTGIGGVFFKCADVDRLRTWYRDHLGIESDQYGSMFKWREYDDAVEVGHTIWAPLREDSNYFAPSEKPFMINYRMRDLDAVLEALRAEGVDVDDKVEDYDYGRFGWVMDAESNRIELWQPKGGEPA